MKILIVNNTKIPAIAYGGTERVIWSLGKELVKLGHEVVFLVKEGSTCDFAQVKILDFSKSIAQQIDDKYDVIHAHFDDGSLESANIPFIVTFHGNTNDIYKLNKQTVFVSKNHAQRFGSHVFVHNGLDWDEYPKSDFLLKRKHFHFLGKAAWRIKNVKGAIASILKTKHEKLYVLGGVRFNISMGLRFTFSPRIKFIKSVNNVEKAKFLNTSKGLIFPVLWHEPFGLAIIESLYYGCPVFGTPYGSLSELIIPEVGFLSNSSLDLTNAIKNADHFDPLTCHQYALEKFNSKRMALDYIELYKKAIAGEFLNLENPQLIEVQNEKFLEWS